MTALLRRNGKGILIGLAPVLVLVFVGLFALNACDPGDSPDVPTAIEGTDDTLFDEARPGVTVRANPSTVVVPDPVTGESGKTGVVATYRDPAGNPVAGLQMNFTADPYTPAVSFNPPAAFTNTNGVASTEASISKSVSEGSLTIVAYTSPASAGPNAKGQTTIHVNVGEIVTAPQVPSGNTSPTDLCIATASCIGVNTGPISYSTAGGSSNLGNDIEYRFDCGNGTVTGLLGPGVTSTTCTYTAAGSFAVRAQAVSNTGVSSDWSGALTVSVTDAP